MDSSDPAASPATKRKSPAENTGENGIDEAASTPGPSTSSEKKPGSSQNGQQEASSFECNICLDTAKDPVISMCGHLFCWPCLHQWLETRPTRQVCPVCKSAISKEKVIPVYNRGGENKDPRDKVPPRPQGQRTEPSATPMFNFGDGGNGGLQFSFGIGAFPFTFFASTFNLGEQRPSAPAAGTRQHEEETFLSKVFVWIAVFFLIWLFLA